MVRDLPSSSVRDQLHRLQVAAVCTRLQPGLFELFCDIVRRRAMFLAAGLPALHTVTRKVRDSRPPTIDLRLLRAQYGNGKTEDESSEKSVFFIATPYEF